MITTPRQTTRRYDIVPHADIPDLAGQIHALAAVAFGAYPGVLAPHLAHREWYIRRPGMDRDLSMGILCDGRLVASVFVTQAPVRLGGRPLSLGIVDTVMSHPDHRRQGLARWALSAAVDAMRERVVRAGFPDLHLNAVEWGLHNLPANTLAPALGLAPEKAFGVQNTLIERFGISSVTSYVWVHNVDLPQFPENAYADVAEAAYADWDRFHESYPVPYHPNVTMGWDAWPRVPQSQPFEPAQYPRTPLITKNPPEAFRAALAQAKDWFATREVTQRVLTLNAWNEWTEGSYLEPDTEFGFGYLEAIRDVFGRA